MRFLVYISRHFCGETDPLSSLPSLLRVRFGTVRCASGKGQTARGHLLLPPDVFVGVWDETRGAHSEEDQVGVTQVDDAL